MHESRNWDRWLWMCGLGLLVCLLVWTLLSRQFIYGEGHASRPIMTFLLSYFAAWGCFLGAAFAVWRSAGLVSLLPVLSIAILARGILLPSELIQENDVYRYVLDGQVLLQGGNPYEFSPWDLPGEASPEIRSSLDAEAPRQVLGRVGYPQIPTVYPPLAQAVFAVGVAVGGWRWQGQRFVFLGFDLLTIIGLIALLDLLEMGRGGVLLYAWNPLVLKEAVNSAHLDVLVAFFLVCLLLALSGFRKSPTRGWLILSAVSLSGAILSKLYPVLLLPIILSFVWRQVRNWRHPVLLALLSSGLVVLGFAPFLGIGVERLFRGLVIYATDWRMNEGFFSILSGLSSQPRLWASGICFSLALLLPLLRPPEKVRVVAEQFHWLILTWFLVMPAAFPWYGIPLLALLVVSKSLALRLSTLMLSGVVALYYFRFQIEYHEIDSLWWAVARGLEHTLIWLSIGIGVKKENMKDDRIKEEGRRDRSGAKKRGPARLLP